MKPVHSRDEGPRDRCERREVMSQADERFQIRVSGRYVGDVPRRGDGTWFVRCLSEFAPKLSAASVVIQGAGASKQPGFESAEAAITATRDALEQACKATHAFVGSGAKCEYDWPDGDEPSDACGRTREEH